MSIRFTCPHCGATAEVRNEYALLPRVCDRCGKPSLVPPQPLQFSAKALLGIVTGVCVVFALIKLASPDATTPMCQSKLRQIALAMHQYHAAYGSFPPAYVADEKGKPMHSWRVLLLPFLEHQDLFDAYEFGEPWNGPNNRRLAKTRVDVFTCPGEYRPRGAPMTSYVLVTGPGTAFDGDKAIGANDVIDGTAMTVMVVEMANSAIHWMEPRDLPLDEMSLIINDRKKDARGLRSHHHGDGANVVFFSAWAAWVKRDAQPAELKAVFTISAYDFPPAEY